MSAPADAPLLETRALGRVFPGRRRDFGRPTPPVTALADVDITIRRGTNLAVVGESGSGKSTLARLVMALDTPTSGEVLHQGKPVSGQSAASLKAMRRGFQMVFQDPFGSLDPRKSVGHTIADPMRALAGASRVEAREAVRKALDAVGLPADAASRYPHEFSGGQRQRIAIARAIITRPALVVADEPVSALDVSIQAQVLNLLIDLHESRGVTYLFISHDLAVVRHIASEVAVMYAGRVVETGPTPATFDDPRHPYTRALVASVPRPGVAAPPRPPQGAMRETPREIGCAYRARCPIATERCAIERPLLRPIGPGRAAACHEVKD